MAIPFFKAIVDIGGKTGEVLNKANDGLKNINTELNKINDIVEKISELREKVNVLDDKGIDDNTIPIKDLKPEDMSPELKETAKEINGLEDKIENEQIEIPEVPSLLDKVGSLIDSLQEFIETLNKTLETLKGEIEEGGLTEEMKESLENFNSTVKMAQDLLERSSQIRDSLMDIISGSDTYDFVDLDEEDEDDFESDGE